MLCLADGWESASMSEDDEDGEWVNMHHSSDEDQAEVVRIIPLSYLMMHLILMMGNNASKPVLSIHVRLRNYRVSQRTSANPKLP